MMASRGNEQVSIAGNLIDPLSKQDAQRVSNQQLAPTQSATWLVQFTNALDAETITELRTRFGLRLVEYVPPGGYVELLAVGTAQGLQEHPLVRAVMKMGGNEKLHARLRSELENNEPGEPGPLDIVVFAAAADEVLAKVRAMVADAGLIAILDDRAHGGSLVLRVRGGSRLAAMAADLDGVRWVQEVPEIVDDMADDDATSVFGESTASARIDVSPALGVTGIGQVIGIIDNGPPDLEHRFFFDPSCPEPGPSHRKIVAVRNVAATNAGKHATFTSGIAAGDDVTRPGRHPNRGVAWGARLVSGNRGDLKMTSALSEFTAAARAGAFVHSNSWHSAPQGFCNPATYEQGSCDVDTFCWLDEDQVVIGSSGNVGEEQGEPGTAKNVLCVSAAATMAGDVVGDGCHGPTADGRRKPELVGVGCGVTSALIGTGEGVGPSAPCASSYATPWVAGVIALVRQQLMEGRCTDGQPSSTEGFVPSGALLRAIALSAAVSNGTDVTVPSMIRGWGFLDPSAALGQRAPRILVDVRNVDGLSTGGSVRMALDVQSAGRLTVTLVWTEPPGAVGSDRCIVNKLVLRVVSPAGQVYAGNGIVDGVSVVGKDADSDDCVEMVLLDAAMEGRWQVHVDGVEVNVGNPRQGFAVVIGGPVSEGTPLESIAPGAIRYTVPMTT